MACDQTEVITSAELTGLKADIVTIDDVVESSLDTTTTKSGKVINTLLGQLKELGYIPPITYAGSIVFTTSDNTKTVDESGVIYAPLPSALPFTTSGTFIGDDDARFFVVQGLTADNLGTYGLLSLTLAEAVASMTADVGDSVMISDRASGIFDYVLASGVTPDTLSIVQCVGVASLALLLRSRLEGNVDEFGAIGSGLDIDADNNVLAIQSAIDIVGIGGVVRFSQGTYMISSHLEERTNGGRRNLVGESQKNTTIKATAGFTSVARGYMLWMGTDTTHGSYAHRMRDLRLDANDVAVGCLFVGENGQGDIRDCDFLNFLEVGYRTNYATDAKITNCEFLSTNNADSWGIVATCAGPLAPQDPSGYSFSYSVLLFSPSNEMKIRDCWFSGPSHAIWINGEHVEIEGCTLQSLGKSTVADDLLVVSDGTFDADDIGNNFPIAGPMISNNWSEGGFSRYFIRVEGYAGGVIEKNLISGSSNPLNKVREGGILVDVPRTVVRNNQFYQFFTATPTEGRLDNAGVYFTAAALGSKQYDNTFQLTQEGNQPYEEGTADPTADKSGLSELFGVIEWSDPTTPILTSNSNGILSVVHLGTGKVQVNFNYNVDSLNYPVLCTVGDSGAFTPAFVNYRWNGAGSIRISIADQAGAGYVPDKVSFMVFGQSSTATL